MYKYVAHDLPLLEFRVNDTIREAFATDTDAFQHTVTLQLMQHQVSINHTCTHTPQACCVIVVVAAAAAAAEVLNIIVVVIIVIDRLPET